MLNIKKKKLNNFLESKINEIFKTNDEMYIITDTLFIKNYNLGRYKFNCYIIPGLISRINLFLNGLSQSGETYNDILKKIQDISDNVYIVGGTIRDIFSNKEINDLDLSFSSSLIKVRDMCNKYSIKCYISEEGKYVKLYSDIEGFYNTYRTNSGPENDDFSVNKLLYDTKNGVLITFSNCTLNDIIEKKIRIPVLPNRYNKWVMDWKKPLRYFSLISKGYTPIDIKQQEFIVNYINTNYDIYLKQTCGYSRIKYYIIKYITGGDIINDTIYYYGYNVNKLVDYLKSIKKIDKTLYKKIGILLSNGSRLFQLYKNMYSHLWKTINNKTFLLYTYDKIKSKYDILLKEKDFENTYETIFNNLYTITDNIYIYGGWVRDSLLDIKATDIEISFNSNVDDIKKLCSKNKWPCSKIIEKYKYIIFGKEKGISLEGNYNLFIFNKEDVLYDFTINQLVYDTKNNIIIDLTGYGIYDVFNKKIRLPVSYCKYNEWASANWKHPLVYFKLLLKGFTPFDEKTEKFIVSYIEDNFDTIYQEKICNSSRIKFYLVEVLTHGTIKPDGYRLGKTKNRLIPYLNLLKKHLRSDIFEKIINSL